MGDNREPKIDRYQSYCLRFSLKEHVFCQQNGTDKKKYSVYKSVTFLCDWSGINISTGFSAYFPWDPEKDDVRELEFYLVIVLLLFDFGERKERKRVNLRQKK